MSAFKPLTASSALVWANHAYDIVTRHFWSGTDPLAEDGNIVFGTSGNDRIDGYVGGVLSSASTSRGSDIVFGGAGNDSIVGYGERGPSSGSNTAFAIADKADYLDGGSGDDSIDAGGGNDIVIGGAGNDYLFGGIGDDIVQGGAGNDVIASGEGADRLWGGAGRDLFSYARDPSTGGVGADTRNGVDVIFDFKPGTDKVEFQGFSPIAGSVQLIDNGHALEIHFDYQYISGVTHAEVDLLGVHSLKPNDLVFA
jgi:Ca2+-binding RTX toxin-like protein